MLWINGAESPVRNVMRVRRAIVAALVLSGVAGLLAAIAPAPHCPLEVKLGGIEPSGVFDDQGNECLLMDLTIRNREVQSSVFEANGTIQAKLTNCWVEMPQTFASSWIYPGKTTTASLMVPALTDACRLCVSFRMAHPSWKARLLEVIGLRGRTLLAKSPLLCKWVWPDERRAIRVSRRWRHTTVELVLPPRPLPAARNAGRMRHQSEENARNDTSVSFWMGSARGRWSASLYTASQITADGRARHSVRAGAAARTE
jgi:hypothetical protein